MAQIYLLRHAPTISNGEDSFMGRLDSPCSEVGLQELALRHTKLALLRPDVLLCSPLERALTTAESVFPEHSIRIVEDLTERDLGDWSGLFKDDIRKRHAEAFLSSGKMDPFYCPPHGESWADFLKRGENVVALLDSYPPDRTVVAVTHNGIIRLIRYILSDLSAAQIFAANEPYLTPIELPFSEFKKPASIENGL